MGISISYSGSLDDPARLNDLIAFARERASKFGWRVQEVCEEISGLLLRGRSDVPSSDCDDDSDPPPVLLEEEVRGIRLLPPSTEAVTLTFNRAGQLSNYYEIPSHMMTSTPAPGETYFMELGNWTQLTGEVSVHIKVVTLLQEIKNQFMTGLEVHDETGYYETGDLANLLEEHMLMGAFLNSLRDPEMLRLIRREVGLGSPEEKSLTEPAPEASERPRTPQRRWNRKARAAVN